MSKIRYKRGDKGNQPTFSIRLRPGVRAAVNEMADVHDLTASDLYRRYIREGLDRDIAALEKRARVDDARRIVAIAEQEEVA
jgi:hypothetical protein